MTETFRDRLYQFLSDFIKQNGVSPTFAEMTKAMGISSRSKSLISRNLHALKKEGKLILKKEGRHLLISLPDKHMTLRGRISAGAPIEAISELQFIDVNTLFNKSNQYALEVRGNSMVEEGIFDGDIIICSESSIAIEGNIVVALIDKTNTTLKKISFKKKGKITLIPANSELQAQIYAPERVEIQGIYQGLFRTCS